MLNPPYINFRVLASGGGVRPRPVISLTGLERQRKIVLLIHGFNTTKIEAREGYEAFDDLLKRVAPRLARCLCPVYWPGDSHLKAGGYPWLVNRAAECGDQLANWLASQKGEIIIVAHSLGCRLTLEALSALASLGGGPKIRVFLMAAAVPVELIRQVGHLRDGLERAESVDVLHSEADGVLAVWFRLGQSLAPGEGQMLPEAVGLRGRPGKDVWTRAAEMPGYSHGEYWIGPRMASHVAHRLGAPVAKPRPVRLTSHNRVAPERPKLPPRPDVAPRRLVFRR
ncbi:MAG: alpha/beta hydrolase [Pseudomonadota bacterium]